MVKTITKKQIGKFLNFLAEHRSCVGFSDWSIDLINEATDLGPSILARVETNMYEKKLTIDISEEFLTKSEERQARIFFHELVHARVRYTEEKINEFKHIEEEHLVNDLVRGFDDAIKFKFVDTKVVAI